MCWIFEAWTTLLQSWKHFQILLKENVCNLIEILLKFDWKGLSQERFPEWLRVGHAWTLAYLTITNIDQVYPDSKVHMGPAWPGAHLGHELCNLGTYIAKIWIILSWCWWNLLTSANQITQIGSCERLRIMSPTWKNSFQKRCKTMDDSCCIFNYFFKSKRWNR